MMIGVIAGQSAWAEYYAETVRKKPTSVFARSTLYTKQEIYSWQVGAPAEIGECLFFPPEVQTAEEARAIEEKREGSPGFVIAKWVKK